MQNNFEATVPPVAINESSSDESGKGSTDALLPGPNQLKNNSSDVENRRRRRKLRKKRHEIAKTTHPATVDQLSPTVESITPGENVDKINSDEISTTRKHLAVFVLFLINLLNYMDRYTVAGVLLSIKQSFGISNASAGLLQTVFIISYMVFAPLFGYLGDRYNRKVVMLVGMVIWSGCTLLASFITKPSDFLVFLALRGLVGIGEASYSTIAPTVIADLFVKTKRTRMLSVFFFAIPVGSGLGYIVGSAAAKAFGSWHWALRITPALGVITMILMIIIIPNPRRGGSETNPDSAVAKGVDKSYSSYWEDLKYVLLNRSFMAVSIGFTFMAFVVGSLSIWGPVYVAYAEIVSGSLLPCTNDNCEYANVSFVFGLITCLAGFLGVWIGAESSKKWKEKGNANADAHVCAIGLIASAPLMLCGFQLATININASWTFIFFADLFLCLTWTLVGDMSLYVTLPNKRSTAQAVQILTMHLFGDAGSPYLLGVMSDSFTAKMPDTYYSKYIALQLAMYVTLFAAVLGGAGFLVASIYLQSDKAKVDEALATMKSVSPSVTTSTSSESLDSVQLLRATDERPDPPRHSTVEEDRGDYSRQQSMETNENNDKPVSHSPPYMSVWKDGNGLSADGANSFKNCTNVHDRPQVTHNLRGNSFNRFLGSKPNDDSVKCLVNFEGVESDC